MPRSPTLRQVHSTAPEAAALAVVTSPGLPISPSPSLAAQQWEYLALAGGEQHRLNELGALGWEAYGCAVPGRLMFYLKRRVIKEKKEEEEESTDVPAKHANDAKGSVSE